MIKWIVRLASTVTFGLFHLWNLVVNFNGTTDGKIYW